MDDTDHFVSVLERRSLFKNNMHGFWSRSAASFSTISAFYGTDTLQRRLMLHRGRIWQGSFSSTASNLNSIAFAEDASLNFRGRFYSLHSGFFAAIQYQFMRRLIRINGQEVARDNFENNRDMDHISANILGGLTAAATDAILLPIDIKKMRAQLNPHEENLTVRQMFRKYPFMDCYHSFTMTCLQKTVSLGTLFGMRASIKSYLYMQDLPAPSVNVIAAYGGAAISTIVTHPLDVIRTNMFADGIDCKLKGRHVVERIWQQEGVKGFYRAFMPKLFFQTTRIGTQLYLLNWFADQLASFYIKDENEYRCLR